MDDKLRAALARTAALDQRWAKLLTNYDKLSGEQQHQLMMQIGNAAISNRAAMQLVGDAEAYRWWKALAVIAMLELDHRRQERDRQVQDG